MTGKSLMPSRNRFGMPVPKRSMPTFDSLFKNFFGEDLWDFALTQYDLLPTVKGTEFPKVNVSETESGYEIDIAVAGFSKEDVSLTLKDNQLIIEAEKKEEFSDDGEKKNYLHKEIAYRSFSRSIGFPKSIDDTSCEASYENGVIKVNLKKVEIEEKPDGVLIEVK